jgi:biotin operon repressor
LGGGDAELNKRYALLTLRSGNFVSGNDRGSMIGESPLAIHCEFDFL